VSRETPDGGVHLTSIYSSVIIQVNLERTRGFRSTAQFLDQCIARNNEVGQIQDFSELAVFA